MCGCGVDRRRFLAGLVGGAASAIAPGAAGAWTPNRLRRAMVTESLCAFDTGLGAGLELRRGAPVAHAAVQSILDSVGRRMEVDVYDGDVPNAAALIVDCRPAIVYNRSFIASIRDCGGAALSVLAHEVGHHVNGDLTRTAPALSSAPLRLRDRELRADRFSGHALRRMGVALDDALSAIECAVGTDAPQTLTHPSAQERIDAIIAGWDAA